jgi:hypothetical protein
MPSTVNDAEDIATALSNLRYQVDLRWNLDIDRFDEAISAYIRKLEQYASNQASSSMQGIASSWIMTAIIYCQLTFSQSKIVPITATG